MTTENEWEPWEDDNPQCPHCSEEYINWYEFQENVFDPSVNFKFKVDCPACGKEYEVMSSCHVEFRTRKLT